MMLQNRIRPSVIAWTVIMTLLVSFFPVPHAIAVSSWSPTLLVNTEAFNTIDAGDGSSNVEFRFGNNVNRRIYWDVTAARFVMTQPVLIQGNVTATGSLSVKKTLSGAALRVDKNADIWGTLGVSGSTVFNKVNYLWPTAASASGKVLKVDPASGQLSWSADQTGGGGGIAQTDADARYVNQSGDTMTGALSISNSAGLNASGTLLTNSDATINSDRGAADAVLTFGNATANQTLKFLNTNQRFQFSKGLSVQGNLSGTTLRVDGNADVWGNIAVSGATVFKKISYLWPGSPASATGKVLKIDPASGQLSWSTDQSGGGGAAGSDTHVQYNDGGSALGGESQFRWNKTTDVLTVAGTASGRMVYAQDRLAVSGSLVMRSGTAAKPTLFANGGNKVGIGTNVPETELEVVGTMSGRMIHAQNRLSASGAAVLGGALTFKPSATQTISAAGNSILANAARVVLDPSADFKLTSTPTIADGTPGQVIVITAANAEANTVTLQDENTLASTNLELGAPTRIITGNTSLTLMFDGTDWVEIASNEPRLITARLNADQSNSTTTLTEVTALSRTVGSGTYVFQYVVRYQAAATTTGVRFAVNFTGTNRAFVWNWRGVDVSATAATAAADQDEILATGAVEWAFASRAVSTVTRGTTLSVDTANADMLVIIEGMMVATTSGDLELWHGSEVAAASTVKPGTSLIITKTN